MARQPTTVRIARWSTTHPWRAIGAWLVFVTGCVLVGGLAGTTKQTQTQAAVGEWRRAERIIEAGHFPDVSTENILISAPGATFDRAAAGRAATEVTTRMRGLAEVAEVTPPLPSRAGNALLVRVTLRPERPPGTTGSGSAAASTVTDDAIPVMLATTAEVARHYPQLRIEEVGSDSVQRALKATTGADFKRAEVISVPLTLAILLVAFGALIAAGVPVLLALSAVAAAIGLSALSSHLVPATDSLNSLVLLIGLAVGVDYSLFYIRREREERRAGRGHIDALEIAAATSGHAVVVSGLAVVIAMAGLFVAGDATFASMAIGAILVVGVAVLGSLTVLPALLATLGRWVDRPRIPLLWRLSAGRGGAAAGAGTSAGADPGRSRRGGWTVLLQPALAHPVATLVVSVTVLLALAAPALGMNLKLTSNADLPRSIPIMASYDRLQAAFPGSKTTLVVAVQAPPSRAAAVRAALGELARRAAADPDFAHDRAPQLATSTDRRVSTLTIDVPFNSTTGAAAQSLHRLRATLVPQTVGTVAGASFGVSGAAAAKHDFVANMWHALPWVVAFVLALTFVVLMLTFRSPVIALTAIVLNSLSSAAALGLLTWVFQGSWAEGPLDFHSNGGVIAWLPLMLFVILFGLSMDYHVFVVSRIREAALRGTPTSAAVQRGIISSAGTVTSAAVVMVAVFSVFATLSTLDMKQLGVGLGAAILIDATVIRAVVLPAAMTLFGRWNWWTPGWLSGPRSGGSAAEPREPEHGPELVPVA